MRAISSNFAEEALLWANVTIKVWDASTPDREQAARAGRGRLLVARRGHNMVTRSGRNLLRDYLDPTASAPGPLSLFALGSSSTAVTANDTALGAELLRGSITRTVSDETRLIVQYFLPSSALNGSSIWEAALLTAGSRLYARYVLDATAEIQPKTSGVAVTFTWELTWTVTGTSMLERGSIEPLFGSADAYQTGNAYPSGATFDTLVPGSGVWFINTLDLPAGTYALEAIVRVSTATAVPRIALFNLSDGSPDTALTGSEVAGTAGSSAGQAGHAGGQRVRSGTMTLPASGSSKTLGVKAKTDEAAADVWVWGIRIVRTS